MKFRKLLADEIECRISMVKANGVSLLLYKDARCDQRLLDETVGPFNWKRTHQLIGDRLYCTLEIKDPETGEWIAKQDVGTESYTEKEKGQASDAFKRACFNWGIGRELYTAPFIWISSGKAKIEDVNGKKVCRERFSVGEIEYSGEKISYLTIQNGKDETVYSFGNPSESGFTEKESEFITDTQEKALYARCQSEGVDPNRICDLYKVNEFSELTLKQYGNINQFWERIK